MGDLGHPLQGPGNIEEEGEGRKSTRAEERTHTVKPSSGCRDLCDPEHPAAMRTAEACTKMGFNIPSWWGEAHEAHSSLRTQWQLMLPG